MTKNAHAASNYNPAEYSYEGPWLAYASCPEEAAAWRADAAWRKHVRENLAEGLTPGGCHHCGTHYKYGAVYIHEPTGSYLVVGHICSTNAFGADAQRDNQVARLKSACGGARKAAQHKARKERQASEFADAYPEVVAALARDHYILADLAANLAQYGSLTEPQCELAIKIAGDIDGRSALDSALDTYGSATEAGTPGKRQDWRLTVTHIASWASMYGTQYLLAFVDADSGARCVWRTSSPPLVNYGEYPNGATMVQMGLQRGATYRVKATVKEHSEYKGQPQTVLTRAKILPLV